MSGMHEHERDPTPETFPDWLEQIEGEYLHLTELYEKEREYGQKLAELMARVQHAVGFAIPLNPLVISAAVPNVSEAQLGEGAVVLYVDSEGNRGTRPLTLMPLETIIFTVHECTFRLKEMISERRRLMARRVRALERVNLELDKAQEVLKHSEPDSPPELERLEEAPNEFADPTLEPDDAREIMVLAESGSQSVPGTAGEGPTEIPGLRVGGPSSEPTRSPELQDDTSGLTEAVVNGFEFKGSFKDKRESPDEKGWGPE